MLNTNISAELHFPLVRKTPLCILHISIISNNKHKNENSFHAYCTIAWQKKIKRLNRYRKRNDIASGNERPSPFDLVGGSDVPVPFDQTLLRTLVRRNYNASSVCVCLHQHFAHGHTHALGVCVWQLRTYQTLCHCRRIACPP